MLEAPPVGWSYRTASGAFMTSEASLLLSREIGRSWAISAGPVVTFHAQSLDVDGTELERNGLDLMVLSGLRRRL
jgi:hypothetical protein